MSQQVHVTPEVDSGERQHVLDESCWCRPRVVRVAGGVRRVEHEEEGRDG